jgi:hypothetical protein
MQARTLDDQASFEFCDGADDNEDRSSESRAAIDVLAQRDELDSERCNSSSISSR